MKKYLRDSILYEDEYVLAVNKPPGLRSIPDRFDSNLPFLQSELAPAYPELWMVHRLDKDTSGVMILAKDADTHRALNTQFAEHQTTKIYHAIAEGQLAKVEGTINYGLAEDPRKPGRVAVSNKGKAAVTHYQVQEQFGHFATLELRIETGRTHQIRVHLQAIGHPVLADPFYGQRDAFYLSTIKGKRKYNQGKYTQERPLLSRTALHAQQLGFTHPQTDEKLTIEAPLPKDMRAVIYQLQKLDTF